MIKTQFTTLVVIILLLWACQSPLIQSSDESSPPNIILIMGDDMGYSDLGCFGGEISTPNLDQLAANGLRFTQFYNTARCCPTRASLLTGLYPQQAGIGHMVNDRGTPAFKGDLSENAVTIAEVLKGADYATYLAGKWHVTPYVIENPDKKNWPLQRGFDKFFGMISGAGSLYDPRSLTEGNEYVAPREGFYSTTDFTNYALNCIEEHEGDNPFFLYVSYMAAHWPMHAPADAVKKYKGKYDKGWDVIRAERYERMKTMGLIKPEWEMTPRDSFVLSWDEDIPDREWEIANMEVYAAMVDLMDQGIGQIMEKLKAKGELENTLIFFLQDNGACAEELQWIGNNRKKVEPRVMEPSELQTEMIPYFTRDGQSVKIMKEAWPGPPEGYTAYGLNWANVSNTPFREYKHWVHEGGISTPLIVHWPKGIQSKGEYRDVPTHLIDIMATCADVAGANYPANYQNHTIIPMEGKSLAPAFTKQEIGREALYWEHEGNRAVRLGKWKLISKVNKKHSFVWDKVDELAIENWELFDMQKDRTEMHNVAAEHPDLVRKMADMWLHWAKRTGIVPRPN